MNRFLYLTLLLIAASLGCVSQGRIEPTTKKQAATSGELFEAIARMDSLMFDAFNSHDLDRLMSLFSDDLEFYHDTGGLAHYEQTRGNFAKLFTNTPDIRRDLVKGSLQIYPVKDYGAIEVGEHRFCHKENGKDDCGTFPFVMVWKKDRDFWKLSRVISYGHVK